MYTYKYVVHVARLYLIHCSFTVAVNLFSSFRTSAEHARYRRGGVPLAALRAERQWRCQRGQHDPEQGGGGAAEEERRHPVGDPEGPEGPLSTSGLRRSV